MNESCSAVERKGEWWALWTNITVYRPPELNKLGRDYMALLIECLDYLCDTRDTVDS